MKLTTTFWSEKVHEFDKILFINGKTKEIKFQADLNSPWNTQLFFKEVAKFVKTKHVRDTLYANPFNGRDVYYQYALLVDGEVTPIKWFDLHVNDKVVISHDVAFDTTLIRRNDVGVPFGHFPMYYYRRNENAKLPKYRELNLRAKACKYMANQIKKYAN